MTTHFRKRPIVIEAFQMTEERRQDNSEWPDWLNRAWNVDPVTAPGALSPSDHTNPGRDRLQLVTLEGTMLIDWGDWIIRGVAGELYPCKPHIFAATYEPA